MKKQVVRITVPEGVTVDAQAGTLSVKGPKGESTRKLVAKHITVKKESNEVVIEGTGHTKAQKRMANTTAAHLKNMISGVQNEHEYHLAIVYSHFPMTLTKKDGTVELANFLGSKQVRKVKIVGHTDVQIKGKDITVKGPNREDVGQTAANLESLTRLSGKDRRIFQDGIYITEKGARK